MPCAGVLLLPLLLLVVAPGSPFEREAGLSILGPTEGSSPAAAQPRRYLAEAVLGRGRCWGGRTSLPSDARWLTLPLPAHKILADPANMMAGKQPRPVFVLNQAV